MYAERDPIYHGDAEPAPGDTLRALLSIAFVVMILYLVLSGLKHHAEDTAQSGSPNAEEQMIVPY